MPCAPNVLISRPSNTNSARPPCSTKHAAAYGTRNSCTSSSSCCNRKCARPDAKICVTRLLVKESKVAAGNSGGFFPLQVADGLREIFDRHSRLQRERAHRRYARQGARLHRFRAGLRREDGSAGGE